MRYDFVSRPFKARSLNDSVVVAIAETGDHAFLTTAELRQLRVSPSDLSLERLAELKARFLVGSSAATPGVDRLAQSRRGAKRETIQSGPSLHIIVPTLQCGHSCRYCQVSRSLEDADHAMSEAQIDAACASILESPAAALTVEFQGGDPLLRFDLVKRAVLRIHELNAARGKRIRFVVATTLHQVDDAMCSFFKEHGVFLSTSIDGPAALHNKNRPTPTRDAYERTVAGIELIRERLGREAVSALMTTTRESLVQPEAIVDEYVRLGFRDIFLRPLSSYGFAKRNQARLGYSLQDFSAFYERGLERALYWNRQGIELREVYASILLNKMLSTFDGGYVDLQSPTGAGLGALVYNYDGYVYPSDEARMLAETGDASLRMGPIGTPLRKLLSSQVQRDLVRASLTEFTPGCMDCAYSGFCAPNPIDAQAQFGTPFVPVLLSEHCRRHTWLFDMLFSRLHRADDWTHDLFHRWAMPSVEARA